MNGNEVAMILSTQLGTVGMVLFQLEPDIMSAIMIVGGAIGVLMSLTRDIQSQFSDGEVMIND